MTISAHNHNNNHHELSDEEALKIAQSLSPEEQVSSFQLGNRRKVKSVNSQKSASADQTNRDKQLIQPRCLYSHQSSKNTDKSHLTHFNSESSLGKKEDTNIVTKNPELKSALFSLDALAIDEKDLHKKDKSSNSFQEITEKTQIQQNTSNANVQFDLLSMAL